ncbi:hypothetical protein ACIBCT_37255 [Streptosporangium sp. NPDC050855]|uniref:hypothetical protein n=1 Tax=Streptosporangium sp. NPDC050855 TaxID=3366194 RepID=UPI00378C7D48
MAQIFFDGESIHIEGIESIEGEDIVVGDITTGSITRGNTVSTHTSTSSTVIGHNDGTVHLGDGDGDVNGRKNTKRKQK